MPRLPAVGEAGGGSINCNTTLGPISGKMEPMPCALKTSYSLPKDANEKGFRSECCSNLRILVKSPA
jgi:hypothetical protein